MKKILPYIYVIVGVSFVIKGFYAFFTDYEIYYLIFSLKTESKYVYILFNLFFGGLILFNGIGKLKNLKK
jgi:hypothetical protein